MGWVVEWRGVGRIVRQDRPNLLCRSLLQIQRLECCDVRRERGIAQGCPLPVRELIRLHEQVCRLIRLDWGCVRSEDIQGGKDHRTGRGRTG